jgi:hypothetical protein
MLARYSRRCTDLFDGGRDAFLSEHHFCPADQYYVQFNSRLYDAKTIEKQTLPAGRYPWLFTVRP